MKGNTAVSWQEKYLVHFAKSSSEDELFISVNTSKYWSLVNLAEDFNFSLEDQPFVIKLLLENVRLPFVGSQLL